MKILACTAAVLLAVTPVAASAETLSNDTVIALTGAGLGEDAIIAKIKTSETHFDTQTDKLLELRSKGVSSKVIAAMIESASGGLTPVARLSVDSPDPQVAHAPGVYLLNDGTPSEKMIRLDPTVSNQAKTGGIIGYALTGGIASLSVKAVIQNEHAKVSTLGGHPTFYFFFDESNPGGQANVATWASGTAATVTSPNEFSLVQLTKKSGRRETRVGSANIGGVKTGVLDKDRLNFSYELVRPGVFKVTPSATLAPGEYGFMYSLSGGGTGGAVTARIYDFGIK